VYLEVQEVAADIQSDLLESWLWRAKRRPLSIVVAYRSEDVKGWESPPANTKALDLVLAYSEQWRSITLNIPEEWLSCIDIVQGKIPLLERVEIKGVLRYNPEVFSVAPRLRSVAFKVAYYESKMLGEISLPWSQLTELSFTADDIQTCLMLLNDAQALRISHYTKTSLPTIDRQCHPVSL